MGGIISGSILEFKIPLNLGYGYCKILDFRSIRSFDGILVKVYNYFGKEPLNDLHILRDCDWLFGARRMPWMPNIRGKGAWKLKGELIQDDDAIIPDFKYSTKSLEFFLEMDYSKIETIWFVVKNISSSTPSCTYDEVKHLEETILTPQRGIEIRTAMEYLRANKMDVGDYFNLDELENMNIYKQMINVPIYCSISKDIRGKALC